LVNIPFFVFPESKGVRLSGEIADILHAIEFFHEGDDFEFALSRDFLQRNEFLAVVYGLDSEHGWASFLKK